MKCMVICGLILLVFAACYPIEREVIDPGEPTTGVLWTMVLEDIFSDDGCSSCILDDATNGKLGSCCLP